jgi:hypothetical protein
MFCGGVRSSGVRATSRGIAISLAPLARYARPATGLQTLFSGN